MVAYNVTAAHITETPDVRGGEPCIAGRGIKVRNVYVWHEIMGMSALEIMEQYNLSLVQVYAALTFAFEHLEEIKRAIRDEEIFIEDFKKTYPNILHLPSDDETD